MINNFFSRNQALKSHECLVFDDCFTLYPLNACGGAALDWETGIQCQSATGAHFRLFDSNQPSTTKNMERKNAMNQYHKLYTPQDSAVVFIDHQPQMTFGVAKIDRASLMNNVTLLAKVVKEFKVPAVLTAVETESFSGYVWPQLPDVFPGPAGR